MQSKQDMPMLGEDDNASDNFALYEDEKSISEAQDIERDHRDSISKSSDSRSHAKARRILQDGLLGSELSSSLKEVRFSEQEFPTCKPISNIIYNHLESEIDNLFYLFNNQLDYIQAHYFAKLEIMIGNIDKFLSDL